MTKEESLPGQESLPVENQPNRMVGVVLLALTGLLFWSLVIGPLNAAAHHEREVSVSSGVMAIPFLLTIAVIFAVLGKNAYKIMGLPKQPSALGWTVTAVTLGLGFYLDYWLKCKLSVYGYNF